MKTAFEPARPQSAANPTFILSLHDYLLRPQVSYPPRKNQAARKKPADSLARSSRSPNGFLHTNTRSRMGVASSITSKEVVVSKFLVLYRSQIGRASCRERV